MYDTSGDDDYDFEAEHGLFINQYSPFFIYWFICHLIMNMNIPIKRYTLPITKSVNNIQSF